MKSKELGAYSRKKTSKEAVENIDKIVKYNEYKETQKYLDPIQLVNAHWLRKRSRKRNLKRSLKTETRLQITKNTFNSPRNSKTSSRSKIFPSTGLRHFPVSPEDRPSSSASVSPCKWSKEDTTLVHSKKHCTFLHSNYSVLGKNHLTPRKHVRLSKNGYSFGSLSSTRNRMKDL